MRNNTIRVFVLGLIILMAGFLFWPGKGLSSSKPKQAAPAMVKPLATPVQVTPGKSCDRFVALGDWGAGTAFQKAVAQQMASQHQKAPFDTVLMLGDNIYPDGNINKLGRAYFTETYAPLIQTGVQFVVALGNHDIVGGFQDDQIRFFKMPGYYYALCRGPFAFFVIDSNTFANDQVQQQWLTRSLKNSTADWKIVVGHHPIYSSGEHGNNPGLKQTLEPILKQYPGILYLAGHDHGYERFSPMNGVQYIVSGGGGAYLRDFPKMEVHSLTHHKAHHFLSFSLAQDTLKMQAIDKTGQIIDTAQWVKPMPKTKQAAGVL